LIGANRERASGGGSLATGASDFESGAINPLSAEQADRRNTNKTSTVGFAKLGRIFKIGNRLKSYNKWIFAVDGWVQKVLLEYTQGRILSQTYCGSITESVCFLPKVSNKDQELAVFIPFRERSRLKISTALYWRKRKIWYLTVYWIFSTFRFDKRRFGKKGFYFSIVPVSHKDKYD